MLGRPYEVRGVVEVGEASDTGTGAVRVYVDTTILLPDYGYYACWLGDGTGRRTAVAALVGHPASGHGAEACAITAVPVDGGGRPLEGSVTLGFVSCLSTPLAGEVAGRSIERLHELLGVADEALN
jgi:hypothetical protein